MAVAATGIVTSANSHSSADLNAIFEELTGTAIADTGIVTSEGTHSSKDMSDLFEPFASGSKTPNGNVGIVTSEGTHSSKDLADLFAGIGTVSYAEIVSITSPKHAVFIQGTQTLVHTTFTSQTMQSGVAGTIYIWGYDADGTINGYNLSLATTGATLYTAITNQPGPTNGTIDTTTFGTKTIREVTHWHGGVENDSHFYLGLDSADAGLTSIKLVSTSVTKVLYTGSATASGTSGGIYYYYWHDATTPTAHVGYSGTTPEDFTMERNGT